MAEVDRNQVLADFQACTNIEDIGECIAVLEQNEWNLMESIQSVMSHLGSQELPSERDTPSSPDLQIIGEAVPPIVHTPPPQDSPPLYEVEDSTGDEIDVTSVAGCSTFNNRSPLAFGGAAHPSRMINFTVEYREQNVPIVLPDTERVETIKDVLMSELGVPKDKMHLRGFKGKHHVEDHHTLKSLGLPKDNTLFLLTPDLNTLDDACSKDEGSSFFQRLKQTFTLNIRYKDREKTYSLNFPGSRTVQEVKNDVFSLTDVPVRYQVWDGWPDNATDDTMTLAGAGLGYPCHNLELTSSQARHQPPPRLHHVNLNREVVDVENDGHNSDDDFEDAHESLPMYEDDADVYVDEPYRKTVSLMPESIVDETEALEHFSKVFGERYGDIHPVFFIGSLENALKEALQCKAKNRKLLAVYLHHDLSILSNVFCSQIFCAETVVSFLTNNLITWAWDITHEQNKARLLTMVTREFGSVAASTVRNYNPDQLPLLLLISRTRGTNEVVNVIPGAATLDELMTNLIQAVDVFKEQLEAEVQEEQEREAREAVKTEQDLAYQQSLMADRAKEEARRQEQEERMQREMEEERIRHEAEMVKQQELAEKEAISQSIADLVPPEPSSDCTEKVTVLRIRVPKSEPITRRFLASNTVQTLMNFIVSKGFHLEDYKVLTTFPRRDITTLDTDKTLEEVKLYPQETLILEER